jgi:hypothetical protein
MWPIQTVQLSNTPITIAILSLHLSVRPHLTARDPMNGFSGNFILRTTKICLETQYFVKIGKQCRALFTKNQTRLYYWHQFEIFCRQTAVQGETQQIHSNNIYTNAPKCYVIRILRVLSSSEIVIWWKNVANIKAKLDLQSACIFTSIKSPDLKGWYHDVLK